jgi:4-amino-4-deoxy-L-arabinose transferase-like glycosyltransferase
MRYAGRLLSALADLGTVYMVYVLGKGMFSRKAGLLAAALTALAVVHVQSSHFYRPETFSVFLVLVCFWAMLRLVERRRLRDSLLLGVLVGLAMAPKVSVLPLVLPLAVAYAGWALRSAGGRWSEIGSELVGRMLLHAGAAGLCALAVFFLLTPYALLDFVAFSGDLAAQANMARHAGLWPFTIQYVDTLAFWYQIRQTTVWGLGIPLGLVAWASIPFTVVMAIKGRGNRQADLLLLSWVVPQIILLESFEVRFLRYYFPLMPFLVLMGARMLVWLSESSRTVSFSHSPAARRMIRALPKLAVVLVVVATAFYSLAFQTVYAREHPAVAASQWLQQNLPPGSVIVSDNHWDEFIPELYRYDLWQFPAYDPDTAEKMRSLASRLAGADYLVFYSYRPYVSVARDPDRFPLTSVYYQRLFNGELGFQLERSFTSYPQFLGVSFRDSRRATRSSPP